MPSSKTAVRRALALAVLTLLLPAVLPAAGVHSQAVKPAASVWSSLEPLWRLLVRAACDTGLADARSCPTVVTASGCEKGSTIDPNGGCTPH
jgi:hypothetical protein